MIQSRTIQVTVLPVGGKPNVTRPSTMARFDYRGDNTVILKILTIALGIVCASLTGYSYARNYGKDDFFLAWSIVSIIVSAILCFPIPSNARFSMEPYKIEGYTFLMVGLVYTMASIVFAISVSELWYWPYGYSYRVERVTALIFGFVISILYVTIGLVKVCATKSFADDQG